MIVAGMAIGNIEVELPPELRGDRLVEGKVVSCEFGNLTRHSDKFFLGITVSAEGAPYLRMSPLIKDKKRYQELCRTNAEVVVTYKAKKRLIGPVRYWVGEITELKHNTSLQPTSGRDAAFLG